MVLFLPALCRKMGVPYCIVKGKARLGQVVRRKTCAAVCVDKVNPEDRSALSKLVETCKNNYNERGDEVIIATIAFLLSWYVWWIFIRIAGEPKCSNNLAWVITSYLIFLKIGLKYWGELILIIFERRHCYATHISIMACLYLYCRSMSLKFTELDVTVGQ